MLTDLQRVHTGIDGLDDLLCGGFLMGDTMLLAGAPGTGKTSLGLQFLFAGATQHEEPGLFITFEEFPERIYRDAGNFGWDLPKLERENKLKIIFTSPDLVQQDLLHEQGIIAEMIHEIGARRVVVDSISLFESHPAVHGNRREAIYGLINALKREGLTSLLIRELSSNAEVGSSEEDFVADGVIVLSQKRVEGQRVRFIEVMKSRGTPHMPYPGMLIIEETGLSVLPAHRQAFYRFEEAMSTGISKLDDLLGGGIPYGSFYLFEVGSDFHQQPLEANFLKEGLEAGDVWMQIGASTTMRRELCTQLTGLGISQEMLEEASNSGRIQILGPVIPRGEEPGAMNIDDVINALEKAHLNIDETQRVRVGLELSPLVISLGMDNLLNLLSRILSISQNYGSVVSGIIQTGLMREQAMAQVRSLADGIIRIWMHGDFNYLQVIKTVNSVRTRVQAIMETPEPPYLKIIT